MIWLISGWWNCHLWYGKPGTQPNIQAKYDYMQASIWFRAVYKKQYRVDGINICTNDKTDHHRSVEIV